MHNWRQFIHRRHQAQVSVVEDMQPRIGDEPLMIRAFTGGTIGSSAPDITSVGCLICDNQ